MTTTNDLINDTLAHLQGNAPQPANRLNGSIGTGDTSILFKYNLERIVPGAIISIGLEELRVWETDGLKTANVVERQVNGTTAAAHADLADVLVAPRFTPYRILRAINNDINDLSSPENGLYRVLTVPEFTYQSGVTAYDLTGVTNEDDVVEVFVQRPGATHEWWALPPEHWQVARDQNLTSFPSGFSITFTYGGITGQSYRIAYKAPFATLSTTDVTVDVATTGLPATAYDLPPLGGALEVMAGREIKRNFTETQGDTRRATEVPPGAVMASVNGIIRQRQRRIMSEASRLSSRYPTMMRTR